jgi:HIP---CoA ligase
MEPTGARTIPQLVRAAAEAYGDREAVVDGPAPRGTFGAEPETVRLSFAALGAEVGRFAGALARAGIRPGDRVAVWAPNSWRWVVAALGIVGAGAVLVPLNTRYKGAEAGYILRRSGARLLVTDDGFLGNRYVAMLYDQDLPLLSTVVTMADWDRFVAGATAPPTDVGPGDLSDIFFTSGTTGHPKGAMLTHEQSIKLYVTWSELAGLREGDRYLLVNPFFNTFGYKAGVLACLLRGATIVPQPVFDAKSTLDLIQRERITVLPGPPTLYTSILDHPERDRYDLSTLRVAVTGATTVPVVLIERLKKEFEVVLTAYGLTESCGTATMCRRDDDPVTVATTCGRPVPGVEVRVDEATGEVLIRGYNVMRGYFEDEAATKATVDADGWLHTGDIGVLDDRGYLRITDRLKDMYIVGGLNVYPAEVEQVLARHPAVADVAVVGVPDERLGEVGRAHVVTRTLVSEDELIAYCRDRLANYKVPRSVVFMEALPRNASGKVVKTWLKR